MFNPLKYFINRKVGLVLGSGGAKGIAHISVIEYLEENKIPIACVSGASIGSIIGALYACGSLQQFKHDLITMDKRKYFEFFDPIFPINGLLKADSMLDFFRAYIPKGQKIQKLPVPLAIVATDYKTGLPVVFREGDLLDAVRASISIPAIFAPVPYKDTILIDGGVANPLPVDVVRDMGAGLTVAVNLHPALKIKKEKEKPAEPKKQEPAVAKIMEKASDIFSLPSFITERAKIIADIGKNTWLKAMKSYLDSNTDKEKQKLPNIFEAIFQTIDIMGFNNTLLMLKYNPPNVLIEPNLLEFGSLDFNRAAEALIEGRSACERAHFQIESRIKWWI